MQAIQTKYHGPGRVRGSRISARCDAGSIIVHLDNSMRIEQAHAAAARQLADKLGWVAPYYGPMHSGALPDGTYAHVFAEPDNRPNYPVCPECGERYGEVHRLGCPRRHDGERVVRDGEVTALRNALAGLLDWAREHTSPRDANSPHELLVKAAAVLDAGVRS